MNYYIIDKLAQKLLLDRYLIIRLIEIEDKRFFQHIGIDIIRMIGAAKVNIQSLAIKEGASTITQQVYDIKQQNICLSYTRSRILKRKLKQVLFALRYEKLQTKENILYYYLTNVYLGENVFGFISACKFYFNKQGYSLTTYEIDFLLKRVKRPNDLDY